SAGEAPVEVTQISASGVKSFCAMSELCPETYTKIGEECFMFSDAIGNWTLAEKHCNLQGDTLAVPSDVEAFLDYIKSWNHSHSYYFIGGRRDSVGQWRWHGGNGNVISDSHWTSGHLYSTSSKSNCTTVNTGDECFMFSDKKRNWTMAQEDCKLRGDILAVPTDLQSFLAYIKRYSPAQTYYFIGGKRDSAGEWKWHDEHGSVISNKYWATGHPYDEPDPTESKCTLVGHEEDGMVKWVCSYTYKYICQRSVNQECYSIPILITLIILLLFLIVGLSVYMFVVRKRLKSSLVSDLSPKSVVRHDSENSLYGKL
ncbi:unnamed protein product, partial [Meganyctiphanes norvegica]